MSCNLLSMKTFKDIANTYFRNERLPINGGIELTSKCNLKCFHCYAECDRSKRDMTSTEIRRIIDELAENEVLGLFFSGGEAITHPDFLDIYIYTRMKGIFVSLMTNGTIINDKHLDVFNEYPLDQLSISMYGFTETTYERVTNVQGSYKKFINSLEKIHKSGIKFELKTVVLNINKHEVFQMKQFAKELGVNFRYDYYIRPMNNRNNNPLLYRISPEEAFYFDIEDINRKKYWHLKVDEERRKQRRIEKYQYACSIAQNNFFISSSGQLFGCAKEKGHGYDLLNGSFKEGWEFLKANLIDKKATAFNKCIDCEDFYFCDFCPAEFELVTGDAEKPDKFACEIAKKRHLYYEKEKEVNASGI